MRQGQRLAHAMTLRDESTVSQLIRQPLFKHGTRSILFQSQRLHSLLREFLTSRNLRREHWQGGTKRRVLLFEPIS